MPVPDSSLCPSLSFMDPEDLWFMVAMLHTLGVQIPQDWVDKFNIFSSPIDLHILGPGALIVPPDLVLLSSPVPLSYHFLSSLFLPSHLVLPDS